MTERHIDHLWAFIASDESGEGLAATQIGYTWYPLIAADDERLIDVKAMAQAMRAAGMKIKMVKFTVRQEIDIW